MGVLDSTYGAALDPQTMGLLSAAFAGLEASGPSRMPTSLGQVVGRAGQSGLNSYAGALNSNRQNAQTEAMINLEKQKAALAQQQAERLGNLGRLMSDEGPGPSRGALAPVGLSTNAATAVGAPWADAKLIPQQQPQQPSQADFYKTKATILAKAGFLDDANKVADLAKKLDPELEFKDGVWYDKRTGVAVRGGAGINQQGFGYQTQVAPGGGISVGSLSGAPELYAQQQQIGAGVGAMYGSPIQLQPTGPNQSPSLISPYNFARQQGAPALPGMGAPQAVQPSASGPTPAPTQAPAVPAAPGAVPSGMSPAVAASAAADAAQKTDVAKNYGSIYNGLQNAAMSNPAKIAKVERVGQLLEGFEGGKFSKTAMDVASAGNSLGIKIDPSLPAKQAAEALSKEMALDLRSTANGAGMPGAMSDADRDYLKSMTPDVGTTAQGRKMIVDAKVSLLKRETQVAGMARAYTKKYGVLNEDFFNQLQGWSERNPIFKH